MGFLSALRNLGVIFGIISCAISSAVAEASPRQIHLWHGEEQVFGQPAQTQKFINIFGNVTEPETLARLSYSLNGADPRPLSIGPDKRRLEEAGDFNLDIPTSDLRVGANEVTIVATDGKGSEATRTLSFEYRPARIKDREYVIRWNSSEDLQRLGMAVDGRWEHTPEGLRPAVLGYDRSFAIGDWTWTDYEITVPIEILGVEPRFAPPSNGAAFFVILRWQGHTAWDDTQPAYGYWPLGGAAAISWSDETTNTLRLVGNKVLPMGPQPSVGSFLPNVPYLLKMQVETLPGYASFYRLKTWESGTPEPSAWEFHGRQGLWNPLAGSVLLVAHHADIRFGDITMLAFSRSPWDLFVTFGSYAAQIPLLLVCLAAALYALRRRKDNPAIVRSVWIAVILIALVTLAGVFLSFHFPNWMHQRDWDTNAMALLMTGVEFFKSAILALALGILLYPLLRPTGP